MKLPFCLNPALAVTALVAISACTWVKPEGKADAIALVKPAHVAECKKLGSVYSNTHHRILGLNRGKQKVSDELLTLAKNEAHSMGADTLVADTGPDNGEQRFTAYKCSP